FMFRVRTAVVAALPAIPAIHPERYQPRSPSREVRHMSAAPATVGKGRPLISSDEALRTARLDGERAYRDLSPYRIQIALEPDGWHIDYQLNDPNRNGGGPHYVIDAQTGAIVSKVYEQ